MAVEELRKRIPLGGFNAELIVLSSVSDDDTVDATITNIYGCLVSCFGIGSAPAVASTITSVGVAEPTLTIFDPSGDRVALLVLGEAGEV